MCGRHATRLGISLTGVHFEIYFVKLRDWVEKLVALDVLRLPLRYRRRAYMLTAASTYCSDLLVDTCSWLNVHRDYLVKTLLDGYPKRFGVLSRVEISHRDLRREINM